MATPFFNDDDFVDPNENHLEALVGEGKKFKTPEELARGKAEADAHVRRLEKQIAEMREQIGQTAPMEKLVQELKALQNPPANNQKPQAAGNEDQGNKPTPVDVESLLDKKLTERERNARIAQNLNFVEQKLIEAFGPNYRSTVTQRARELGLDQAFLTTTAETNPNAFLKLLDVAKPTQEKPSERFFAPPAGANTSAPGKKFGTKNAAYYSNLRKTNPSEYFSVRVQQEMFDQAKTQGDAFYN